MATAYVAAGRLVYNISLIGGFLYLMFFISLYRLCCSRLSTVVFVLAVLFVLVAVPSPPVVVVVESPPAVVMGVISPALQLELFLLVRL